MPRALSMRLSWRELDGDYVPRRAVHPRARGEAVRGRIVKLGRGERRVELARTAYFRVGWVSDDAAGDQKLARLGTRGNDHRNMLSASLVQWGTKDKAIGEGIIKFS